MKSSSHVDLHRFTGYVPPAVRHDILEWVFRRNPEAAAWVLMKSSDLSSDERSRAQRAVHFAGQAANSEIIVVDLDEFPTRRSPDVMATASVVIASKPDSLVALQASACGTAAVYLSEGNAAVVSDEEVGRRLQHLLSNPEAQRTQVLRSLELLYQCDVRDQEGDTARPPELKYAMRQFVELPTRQLVTPIESNDEPRSTVEAVFVPTIGPDTFLWPAVELTAALDVPLFVLCSDEAQRHCIDLTIGRDDPSRIFVIDTSRFREHPMLKMKTKSHPLRDGTLFDLSNKRNLGLLIATLMGWERILFLDDDVYDVSVGDVKSAASTLGSGPGQNIAVLIPVTGENPDRSESEEAAALLGFDMPVLGGGELLVVYVPDAPPMPDKHDEDYDMLLEPFRRGRVGIIGEAKAYHSFRLNSPLRFVRDEWACLATHAVLYELARLARVGPDCRATFDWKDLTAGVFARSRQDRLATFNQMISYGECLHAGPHSSRAGHHFDRDTWASNVKPALLAGIERAFDFDPEVAADFYAAYFDDCGRWHQAKAQLPKATSIAEALTQLMCSSSNDPVAHPVTHCELTGSSDPSAPLLSSDWLLEASASARPDMAKVAADVWTAIAGSKVQRPGRHHHSVRRLVRDAQDLCRSRIDSCAASIHQTERETVRDGWTRQLGIPLSLSSAAMELTEVCGQSLAMAEHRLARVKQIVAHAANDDAVVDAFRYLMFERDGDLLPLETLLYSAIVSTALIISTDDR